MIDNRVEDLIKAIGNLRNFHHSGEDVKNIRNCLDRIFKPDATCINFVYTVKMLGSARYFSVNAEFFKNLFQLGNYRIHHRLALFLFHCDML